MPTKNRDASLSQFQRARRPISFPTSSRQCIGSPGRLWRGRWRNWLAHRTVDPGGVGVESRRQFARSTISRLKWLAPPSVAKPCAVRRERELIRDLLLRDLRQIRAAVTGHFSLSASVPLSHEPGCSDPKSQNTQTPAAKPVAVPQTKTAGARQREAQATNRLQVKAALGPTQPYASPTLGIRRLRLLSARPPRSSASREVDWTDSLLQDVYRLSESNLSCCPHFSSQIHIDLAVEHHGDS